MIHNGRGREQVIKIWIEAGPPLQHHSIKFAYACDEQGEERIRVAILVSFEVSIFMS